MIGIELRQALGLTPSAQQRWALARLKGNLAVWGMLALALVWATAQPDLVPGAIPVLIGLLALIPAVHVVGAMRMWRVRSRGASDGS